MGILALIYSCRQDDFTITSEGEEHGSLVPSPKSNITFQEFLNKFPDKGAAHAKGSSMVDLSKYRFGGTPAHAAARTESTSVIQFIDTTKVLAFDFSYIQTYTFEVIPTEMEANTYYNMVFSVDSLGTHSRLFKYVADAAYVPGSDEAFTGIIYEIAEDGTVITTYTQQHEGTTNVAARVVSCSFSVITINIPCTGSGHHEPGDADCECGNNVNCTPGETIKLTDITCQDYGVGGGGGIGDGNGDGGSNGGGGGGPSDGDPVLPDDPLVFELPTGLSDDIAAQWAAFQSGLTSDQLNYLNSRPVPIIALREQLLSYLVVNLFSSTAITAATDLVAFLTDNPDEYDFGMEALEALHEDAEVDLEEKIINKLTGKSKCIYKKNSNQNGVRKVLNKFQDTNSPASLLFENASLGSTFAITVPPNTNDLIIIKLNSDSGFWGVDFQPNLLVAQTIFHEIIHAEFFRQIVIAIGEGNFDGATAQQVIDALQDSDFATLYEYYRTFRDWDHNYMAGYYRDTIARMIQEYDTGTEVAINEAPQQLYLNLAWKGLRLEGDVLAWDQLSDAEQQSINDEIDNYTTNNNNEVCTEL